MPAHHHEVSNNGLAIFITSSSSIIIITIIITTIIITITIIIIIITIIIIIIIIIIFIIIIFIVIVIVIIIFVIDITSLGIWYTLTILITTLCLLLQSSKLLHKLKKLDRALDDYVASQFLRALVKVIGGYHDSLRFKEQGNEVSHKSYDSILKSLIASCGMIILRMVFGSEREALMKILLLLFVRLNLFRVHY